MTYQPLAGGVQTRAAVCSTGSAAITSFAENFNRAAGASLGSAWAENGPASISGDARPNTAAGNALYLPEPSSDTTPTSSYAYTSNWVTLSAVYPNYLYFQHLDSFDWLPSDPQYWPYPTEYFDGGFVEVDVSGDSLGWYALPATAWINGPASSIDQVNSAKELTGHRTGFGGDSRGWISSRAQLSSALNGKQVRFRFLTTTDGVDAATSAYGWWIDNVSVNTCIKPPAAPGSVVATGRAGTAGVTWTGASANGGPAVSSYMLSLSAPGRTTVWKSVSASTRSYTFTKLPSGVTYTVGIRAVNKGAAWGPTVNRVLTGTRATVKPGSARIRKGRTTTLSGYLTKANGTAMAKTTVTVYYRKHGTSTWRKLTTTVTGSTGKYAKSVKPPYTKTDYKIVYASGSHYYMGATSPTVMITLY
jgi:hypothetical protein